MGNVMLKLVGQKKIIYALKFCLWTTVLPVKSDSDFMFYLQSYQGLIIDISLK